jgi:hypothetical protein
LVLLFSIAQAILSTSLVYTFWEKEELQIRADKRASIVPVFMIKHFSLVQKYTAKYPRKQVSALHLKWD